jgi:peptidyl-prolyl cis-trans isomerase SurA
MRKFRKQKNCRFNLCTAIFAVLAWATLSYGAELIDRIVAVVGGEVITYRELESFTDQFPQMSKEEALEMMIDDMLIEQEAKRQGINVTDVELESAFQTRLAQLGVTEEKFREMLAQQGMTVEQFRELLRGKLVKMRFVKMEIRGEIEVSEEEMLNYYRVHSEEFQKSPEVHLALIIIPIPNNADAQQIEQVRKLANEIYERARAGEDFNELIASYSKGGGDIGWVAEDEMNENFAKAIRGLKAGEVSEPFETERGLNILKVVEVRSAQAIPYEEAKEEIFEKLYDIKIQEHLDRLVARIKERTPIERKL